MAAELSLVLSFRRNGRHDSHVNDINFLQSVLKANGKRDKSERFLPDFMYRKTFQISVWRQILFTAVKTSCHRKRPCPFHFIGLVQSSPCKLRLSLCLRSRKTFNGSSASLIGK